MGKIEVSIPDSALDEATRKVKKENAQLRAKIKRLENERDRVKADKARLDRAIAAVETCLNELRDEFADPWEYV